MLRRQILVIEDDAAIREGIADALTFAGYEPIEAGDGHAGLEMALRVDCDMILLDLVLPGPDGLEILGQVRSVRPTMPVIILTAKGEEKDRVRGLRLGADDYVVKPFSVQELLARIQAVMRRSPERPASVGQVDVPGGRVDFERREVRFANGDRRELSEKESELLGYLVGHAGRAVSRDEILTRLWHIRPEHVRTRTIDMHVTRLREKLRDDPAAPKVIVTVRGKGYMFGEDGGDGS
jgi:DNA-binding response OmpR family regulator